MKLIHYFITTILITFFADFYGQGSRVNYDRDTKWNFGINAGATWTEKELNFINQPGFSGGLTLGRAIYEKEGRLLSFDLRGRLLWGQTKSFSPSPFYDSTLFANASGIGYRNYKLGYTEGSLELVVNAHRLRERTGILLYAFGGIGWVSHFVRHNYKDGDIFYDYSSVDSTASQEAIVESLSSAFNDNSWETDNEFFLGKKTLVMPSLGLGLGYQISPRFSIGIEHKITFGLNDQLDGHIDGKNDRLHYTNANLRWNLFRGERGNGSTYVPEQRPVNNPNVPIVNNPSPPVNVGGNGSSVPSTQIPQGNRPLVNITTPSSNGSTIFTSNYSIEAKVYYVEGKNNIVFEHNGNVVTNYTYNSSSNVLNATVNLMPGSNTFVITATNKEGTDTDTKTINFDKICNKPLITFSKPLSNGITLSNPATTIEATILNITNKNQVRFRQNGVASNLFTFNNSTKMFLANVVCVNGNNTFEIEAANDCGEIKTSIIIIYNKTIVSGNPPIVNITSPTSSPFTINGNQASVIATVLNVNNASNIEYKVNGVVNNMFNYNASTKVFNATFNLQNGSNIIEVKGTNNYGIDVKSTIIIKQVEQQLPKPVVNISYPSTSPFSVTTNSSVVNGTVYNVLSRNQIQVLVNGSGTNNFAYNPSTKQISLTASLNPGANTITIQGSNNSGSDTKSTIIIFKREVVMSPPVVDFVYPNVSPQSVSNPNIAIKVRVLNVSSANQINVVQNGALVQNFNYDLGTKELLLNTNLNSGSNSFVVTATNQAGADTKTTIVDFKRQVVLLPPVVTVLSPQLNPLNTTNSNETVNARVDNVNSQSQIVLNYNGTVTPNFSYNAATKTVTFTARLNMGSNSLTIIASNNSGSDNKSVQIIRANPCLVPTLDFQIPESSPHNHVGRGGNMAFTFSSANLTSINQVTVKNNGYIIPANLEVSNGNIWGTVPLVVGANAIVVSIKNDCGTAEKTLQVLYKGTSSKLDPPLITIQSPSSFPYSTTNSSVTVVGKVMNVSSQNSVLVTMDGSTIPFTYNTATKELTIVANLTVGSHQVKVSATNNYGNDLEVFDLVRVGQPPLVNYTNLGNNNSFRNPFVSAQQNFNVQGKVTNFQNVTFNAYIDGTRISNYTYDASSGNFTIPVSFLIQGQGTQRKREVEVKVSNSSGVGSRKGHLTYIVQSIGTKPSIEATTKPNSLNIASKQSYDSNIKKADDFFNKGNYSQAKIYYQKALSNMPKESYPKQRITLVNNKIKLAKEAKAKVVTPKITIPKTTPKAEEETKPVAKPSTGTKKINSWSTKPIENP